MSAITMTTFTQLEYFSYIFSLILLLATGWLLGFNDHIILKYWFTFVMSILLLIRIPDFKHRKYQHFFYELCYFVNIYAMYILLMDKDIKIVYPYLHGPLLLYAIVSADAFIPHDLYRTTSFALHTFGTIVSRRLYWWGTSYAGALTVSSFMHYFKASSLIYLCWFIPYSIYVITYNGKELTMIRYILKLKRDDSISINTRILYLFKHMTLTALTISFGILLMHYNTLDNIMCSIQVLSGIIQGSYYYYSNGKKLKFIILVKTYFQNKNE